MLFECDGSQRSTFLGLLLLMFLTPSDAQVTETCSAGKLVAFSMNVDSNVSGHTVVHGRIEQHTSNTSWRLGVEFGANMCPGVNQPQSKVLYFTLTDTAPRKLFPPGYTLRPGVGHLRVSARPLAWDAARSSCEREGGHLATASSGAEAELLWREVKHLELPHRVPGVWYGASDFAEEGNFITVTGVPLNDTGFRSFQPDRQNGGKNENCLFLNQETGLLDDGECKWLLGYICKIPL